MKKSRIDQLIAEQESVSNEVLKKALARQIEAEEKATENRLFDQFNEAKRHLDSKVGHLRRVRAAEKEAMNAVKKVDAAFTKFKKDGDFEQFLKTVRGY